METVKEERELKVKSTTDVEQLSKSVFSCYTKENLTGFSLTAIGHGAIGQAVKGLAAANGLLAQRGCYASCVPSFFNAVVENVVGDMSAIRLRVTIHTIG